MEISKFEAEMLQGTMHYYISQCIKNGTFTKDEMSHYYDLFHKLEKFTGKNKED